MKLCIVIVRNFQNSHCSVVCNYCSIVCLIIKSVKSGSKNGRKSNILYENEIYRVDSPSNEDSKTKIFCKGGPNYGEGRPENLGKLSKTWKSTVMQSREWSILIGNTGLYSLVPKSLHCFGFPTCKIKLFAKN